VIKTALTVGGLAIAAALLALAAPHLIPPYPLYVLTLAGINVVLAVSLNLITGVTGQFSIGHAGFMGIGAYGAAWLAVNIGPVLRLPSLLPTAAGDVVVVVACLAFGGLLAALGGLIVGVPSLRLRGDYLAIVTLGFGEIIKVFIVNIEAIGGARGYRAPALAGFGWVLFLAALTVLLVHNVVRSSFGRTLLAVREDEIAAEAMGVNTTRAKVISFVISATLAGMAGALFALFNYITPRSFDFTKSIEIVVMVVIGGLGSTLGSAVGAVLFIALTEGLRSAAEYRMVTFSLLLVLLMIFRPEGLLGTLDFKRKRRDARKTLLSAGDKGK
jgi:branched-chain amino acid transport system permease protein